MNLNDLWLSVNEEINFYTVDTFENVPSSPGVYAWFYPLRVTSKDLAKFIEEVNVVLNYDCASAGAPARTTEFHLGWDKISQHFKVSAKVTDGASFKEVWDKYSSDDSLFWELRKVLMRATIFLPPLYVGKASNLRIRCRQHIDGSGTQNDFHNRYEKYAASVGSSWKKVEDLLFVCVKTSDNSDETEKLIEFILKQVAKPRYSII